MLTSLGLQSTSDSKPVGSVQTDCIYTFTHGSCNDFWSYLKFTLPRSPLCLLSCSPSVPSPFKWLFSGFCAFGGRNGLGGESAGPELSRTGLMARLGCRLLWVNRFGPDLRRCPGAQSDRQDRSRIRVHPALADWGCIRCLKTSCVAWPKLWWSQQKDKSKPVSLY